MEDDPLHGGPGVMIQAAAWAWSCGGSSVCVMSPAGMLARIAHTDEKLLYPVEHVSKVFLGIDAKAAAVFHDGVEDQVGKKEATLPGTPGLEFRGCDPCQRRSGGVALCQDPT